MEKQRAVESMRETARSFLPRSVAPYSGRPAAAVLLLTSGLMVPGVRIESASFPVTLPAALNAVSTAFASGHSEFAALLLVGPVPPTTSILLEAFGLHPTASGDLWTDGRSMPVPTGVIDPFLEPVAVDGQSLVDGARMVAARAYMPESNFPVGSVFVTGSGGLIPGVNVEHPDWTCILCAERNALGTAVTFGELPVRSIGLSCPTAPGASPCGACRQLLAELAPDALVWMDQEPGPPTQTTPRELLPLAFSGDALSG